MHREANLVQQATTATPTLLSELIDNRDCEAAIVVVSNTGANGATWTLQGSIDGTTWIQLTAPATLASAANASAITHDPWLWLQVLVSDQTGGTHTTVKGVASSLVHSSND